LIACQIAEEALLIRLRAFLPGMTVEPVIPQDADGVAVGFSYQHGSPMWQWADGRGEGSDAVWDEVVYQVVAVARGRTLAVVAEADLQIERALADARAITLESGAVVHQITRESPIRMSVPGEDGVLRQVSGGLYRLKVSPAPLS
jgi:hypothetical protein